MKCLLTWILIPGLTMMAACSSENDVTGAIAPLSDGHAWQAQEDAYEKAQQVEMMMDEASRRQRAVLGQQGG